MPDLSQPPAAPADERSASRPKADETSAGRTCLPEIGSIPPGPPLLGHRRSLRRDNQECAGHLDNVRRANAPAVDDPGKDRARSERAAP